MCGLVGTLISYFHLIRQSESRLDFVVFTEVPEGRGGAFCIKWDF